MKIAEIIKRRKLEIYVIGIPKTIDNDVSFIYKTFGFDTAVGEARKAIDAAHTEAKGARNGIGLAKLMGRHSGFIAAHATLASGNVNICLIPEAPLDLNALFEKIKRRFVKKSICCVALHCNHEAHEETRRKRISLSVALGLIFSYSLAVLPGRHEHQIPGRARARRAGGPSRCTHKYASFLKIHAPCI